MKQVTKKEIQDWLDKTANKFDNVDFAHGTVYYMDRIGKGLALVLSTVECGDYEGVQKNPYAFFNPFSKTWYELEVSVRYAYSSYFVDDWYYLSEFSSVGLTQCDKDDHMECAAAFLYKILDEYVEPAEEEVEK